MSEWRRVSESLSERAFGTGDLPLSLEVTRAPSGAWRARLVCGSTALWREDYMTEIGAKAGSEAFAREEMATALANLGAERARGPVPEDRDAAIVERCAVIADDMGASLEIVDGIGKWALCIKATEGCYCAVGFPHDKMCPECRDTPGRDRFSYCVCPPSREHLAP